MREAETLMLADLPVIPIYHYVSKNLVSPRVQAGSTTPRTRTATRWLSLAAE